VVARLLLLLPVLQYSLFVVNLFYKDVVGLLEKLQELAFSTGGIQEPFATLTESFRRLLAAINQGTMETMANYYERFTVSSKLLIGHWGKFYPSKLAKGSSQGDKEAAQDKFLARIFLIGADKRQYGMLVEDLTNNSYIAGKDNYPESLEATLKLLSNYKIEGRLNKQKWQQRRWLWDKFHPEASQRLEQG
jgi:hypothetical protein